MFRHVDSEDFDQTGRIPRLTRVFAGRTDDFVGFVMLRLILGIILKMSGIILGVGMAQYLAGWPCYPRVAGSVLCIFSLSDDNVN